MNLPLPQFLSSALPADAESREGFDMFEALVPYYECGFKTTLSFLPGTKAEFPAILSTWLLSILQRSRLAAWGVIQGVNAANELAMVLAVRALVENAAYLCYARDNLKKTYQQGQTRREMTDIAFRLRFAMRYRDGEDFTEHELEASQALNVLTALKRLDEHAYAEAGGGTRPDLFTHWYARLCEFCHPNALGIEAGTTQDFASMTFTYDVEPRIREGVFAGVSGALFSAQYHFFSLYNESWGLMIDNGERLPGMTPDSDPRIVIV